MIADSGGRTSANDLPSALGLDADAPIPLAEVVAALHDRYEVHNEIGHGGSSFVYRATDRLTTREVAIKLLRPDYAFGDRRFTREIAIASRLHHPSILPLLETGEVLGRRYLTTPYIDGQTLRARIQEQRQLTIDETMTIARAVASAVDYAHGENIIHRDIKPANILLRGSETLVADFGISRAILLASGERITTTGIAVGTPEYMSPEQAAGDPVIDGRSDVYSLACVVYEMLAGEAPFGGPSAQAILIRQQVAPPPSIRVIRPSITAAMEAAIFRALAKTPADRFSTATEFIEALEAGRLTPDPAPAPRKLATPWRIAIGTAVLAVASAATYAIVTRQPPLDANRIVVFPLYDAAQATAAAGEEIATFIGYALDGTRPLKWTDGWELLSPEERSRRNRLETRTANRLSREAGAAFFIDGSLLYRQDTVTVLLRLRSVSGDSTVRLVERSGVRATTSVPQLGLSAVHALLPDLLAPGGRIDLSALSDRRPVAVANFLQGEREYRRMQFAAALPHYHAALEADSVFALAALRGSYAAAWLSDVREASELVDAALANESQLPFSQIALARGLRAYLAGAADSALASLHEASRVDSLSPIPWTLLGEVYSRLLPNAPDADALARQALRRARSVDGDFAPALLLLEELALRDGDLEESERLRTQLRTAGADTTHAAARRLMWACVQNGGRGVDWRRAAAEDAEAVLSAGKVLGGRAAHPACAASAFRAVLASETAPVSMRFGALLGLQAQLIATGRASETPQLLSASRDEAFGYRMRIVYLVGATAGDGFGPQARATADSAAALGYHAMSPTSLWQVGYFEARSGNVERVTAIANTIRGKADSSRAPRDVRLASSVNARLLLMRGDTSGAISILQTLKPSARRVELGWWPWESLGAERLLLAQLLLRRREYDAALRTAGSLDATEPIGYPMYLPASLEVRALAAAALGRAQLAADYRQRLERLRRSALSG